MFVFMNKNKFYNLKVVDIKRMTADSVMLTFDIPCDIKSLFSFNAGQNLTLKTHINGEEIRRSYSLCTAHHTDNFADQRLVDASCTKQYHLVFRQ